MKKMMMAILAAWVYAARKRPKKYYGPMRDW
jgi:hypothetical protein